MFCLFIFDWTCCNCYLKGEWRLPRRVMKKQIFILFTVVCMAVMFTGCGCEHQWKEADCQNPSTCSLCNQTQGEIGDHVWVDADCINPKTCSICGTTEGEALGHKLSEATCEQASNCEVCGLTEGEALGHDWIPVSFENPKTCKTCGITEGGVLVADLVDLSGVSSSYWWYCPAAEDCVYVCNSKYEFAVCDFAGNKLHDINYDKVYYCWNTIYGGLGSSYLAFTSVGDDGIELSLYNSEAELVLDTVYPYENFEKSYGTDAGDVWYYEDAYCRTVDNCFYVYSSESNYKAFYVDLENFSIIAPEDFKSKYDYDSNIYSYVQFQPSFDRFFVAWKENNEWGYLDMDMNTIARYNDATAFSEEGFALVSDDREHYSLIDSDFNVIAEDIFEGISASYGVDYKMFGIRDKKNNDFYYKIRVE